MDDSHRPAAPTTEALRRRGYQTKTDARTVKNAGVDMACIDGQWMSTTVAARLGLV